MRAVRLFTQAAHCSFQWVAVVSSFYMGRFWIEDKFIREEARNLTPETVVVYFYLCSRADSNGHVYVGSRRIADDLGLSKNTAYRSVQKLILSHHVRQMGKGERNLPHLVIPSAPPHGTELPHPVGQKEVSTKEVLRKGNFSTVPPAGHRGTEGSEKWKKLRNKLITKP